MKSSRILAALLGRNAHLFAAALWVIAGLQVEAQDGPPPDFGNRPARPGGNSGSGGPPGKPPGGARTPTKISGAFTVSGRAETTTAQTYISTHGDVSSVLAENGGQLTLQQPTVRKSGNSSNEENSSFFGQNAGVLATKGSRIVVNGGTIQASGLGANGAFATGAGAFVALTDTHIIADGNAAHGVMASAGGAMALTNATIVTSRARSAAVATDRGSGTIFVSGGNYTTHGTTAPGIYSTGKITAERAVFTATDSEASVIEGRNSITLTDCTLSGAVKWGVMIFQSFSGDAEGREGTFTMANGALSAAQGPLFFVSNARGNIHLKNVTLSNPSGVLLNAAAARWGRTGENGGQAVLHADQQTLTGDLVADNLSSIRAELANHSKLTGALKYSALKLDSTSQWIVTADSEVTTLQLAGETEGLKNISSQGHVIRYDAALAGNRWLGGQKHSLPGGGVIEPK